MNIVDELQHLSRISLAPFLQRQLRLYGDAKIPEVIVPLREYVLKVQSRPNSGRGSSPVQSAAADLLNFCNIAIEKNAVEPRLQELICGAFLLMNLQPKAASSFPRKPKRSPMENKIIEYFGRERARGNTMKEAMASWEGSVITSGLRLEYNTGNRYTVHDENATLDIFKKFTTRQFRTMFTESS